MARRRQPERPRQVARAARPRQPDRQLPRARRRCVAEGYNLYEDGCSSCHGIALRGHAGRRAVADRASAPGRSTSTSRPGGCRSQQPARGARCAPRPLYNRAQIDALIAYISRFGGPAGADRRPGQGRPGARPARVHAELRRLSPDRRPRRADARRAGPRPAAGHRRSRSPRRCGWART